MCVKVERGSFQHPPTFFVRFMWSLEPLLLVWIAPKDAVKQRRSARFVNIYRHASLVLVRNSVVHAAAVREARPPINK